MNRPPLNRAVFADRDGTLIEDRGYICRPEEVVIYPYAFEAVRRMNEKGFKVIGVTNQSSVARGICTPEQVENLHRLIGGEFLKQRAVVERFYYCPYHVDGTVAEFTGPHPWRKPNPGMLLQGAADFNIHLPDSFMVGDNFCDLDAGHNAGCRTVLVLTGKGRRVHEELEKCGKAPDFIAENILDAAAIICSLCSL